MDSFPEVHSYNEHLIFVIDRKVILMCEHVNAISGDYGCVLSYDTNTTIPNDLQ